MSYVGVLYIFVTIRTCNVNGRVKIFKLIEALITFLSLNKRGTFSILYGNINHISLIEH